jgi:hypothetical protein
VKTAKQAKKKLTKQQKVIQEWKTTLKRDSLAGILENGLGHDGEAMVYSLSHDEQMEELNRRFRESWQKLKDLCSSSEEIPKDLRDKISHEVFELETIHGQSVLHATEATFDLMLRFFLPQVAYPFAKLFGKGGTS